MNVKLELAISNVKLHKDNNGDWHYAKGCGRMRIRDVDGKFMSAAKVAKLQRRIERRKQHCSQSNIDPVWKVYYEEQDRMRQLSRAQVRQQLGMIHVNYQ